MAMNATIAMICGNAGLNFFLISINLTFWNTMKGKSIYLREIILIAGNYSPLIFFAGMDRFKIRPEIPEAGPSDNKFFYRLQLNGFIEIKQI